MLRSDDMNTPSGNRARLGILMCGHSPDAIVEAFGAYDRAFVRLLGPEKHDYQVYFPVDGDFPESVKDADAWLITGSKHGVYDELPWIAPLEDFVREIYAQQLPMIGICFGHQLMAQALGGQVEKFAGGWVAGTEHYQFSEDTGFDKVLLNAWHQDQVIEKPADSRVIGTSERCKLAALEYRANTVSLQPHPEFNNDYLDLLLEHRGDALPIDIKRQAEESVGQTLHTAAVADWLNQILLTSR